MEVHKPVMLTEVMEYLITDINGVYVDATFGRGGHARQIMKALGPQGQLIAFDKDLAAIDAAKDDKEFADNRFLICHHSFTAIKDMMMQYDLVGKVQGILLDLGVSSPQLDQAERGFSFMRNGPLDMRMDQTQGVAATTWLATVDEFVPAILLRRHHNKSQAGLNRA